MAPLRVRGCRGQHGADDGQVAATTTQVVRQPGANVGLCRARVGVEQDHRLHDHAVGAVAALRRLFLNEGLLEGMELTVNGQAFERRHWLIYGADWNAAGSHGAVADMDGARAALAQPAAKARTVEAELIAEHIQQRRVVAGLDVKGLSVDLKGHPPCHRPLNITRVIPKNCSKRSRAANCYQGRAQASSSSHGILRTRRFPLPASLRSLLSMSG